jgi:hypothetical protein
MGMGNRLGPAKSTMVRLNISTRDGPLLPGKPAQAVTICEFRPSHKMKSLIPLAVVTLTFLWLRESLWPQIGVALCFLNFLDQDLVEELSSSHLGIVVSSFVFELFPEPY